jgi:hypothetical protein
MNETAALERGYRRVLACYPKAFRLENTEEILAVLLASAEDGQRRIGLAESAALVRGGLRMRLRPPGRPPRAVRGAVRLMCAGAVAELAALVTIVLTTPGVRTALAGAPGPAAAAWHAALGMMTLREIGAGAAVAIWLLFAWAISQGRDVARFGFCALFALITMILGVALAQHGATYARADMIAGGSVWLLAFATMVLIFTRQANAYYRLAAPRPAAHAAG